jgi:sugar lactone lactonase YvrE
VCLGKPELQALYITTARKFLDRPQLRSKPLVDGVLAVEVNVRGIVEHSFGNASDSDAA